MPAAVQEASKVDHSERMWKTLKTHILRERARKKQEREQEVEEERLRKERKAREQQLQQDVMTLGETREQISQLEARLTQLKEEKHQLFIQLKKVLNEDDIRRRQLIKENSADNSEQVIAIQALPSNMVNQQLYNPQQQSRLTSIPQQQQNTFKTAIKRPRTPSPPPQVPVSVYHGYGYKPSTVGTALYQNSPQKDDGRRNELVRAVLWNKTAPQYTNQPSAFYPVAPQELSIYYPLSREPARNVYESPRPQAFHLEQKLPEHYALRTATSHGHVIHPGSLPINPQQAQPKGGTITPCYPVRSQPQYQQQSAASASLYTTQSRPLYQTSGVAMNYPTRE